MNKQDKIFGKEYSAPEIELAVMHEDVMTASGNEMVGVKWDSEQWDGQGGGL